MANHKSFWTSFPAVLTGTAALITSLVGLVNHTNKTSSTTAAANTLKTANVDPAPVHTEPEPVIERNREYKKSTRTETGKRAQPHLSDDPGPEERGTRPPQIGGTWRDLEGTSYVISQNGARFAIQELTPHVGVTAEGKGIVGDPITFSARTIDGMTVTGELQLSGNGRQLSGHYTDVLTDESEPIVLRR